MAQEEYPGVVERRLIAVEGVVQGVGFRPFVHRLALAGDLRGWVRNGADGVLIDVEGESSRVAAFCRALAEDRPPMAVIDRVAIRDATPRAYGDFRIVASMHDGVARGAPRVPPDVATCEDCLSELFDPANRRFRHPFITCTACGPRFTIVRGAPYDRARTAMADFAMCPACAREYEDPADRRFHAETIACPACGPTLRVERPSNPSDSSREHATFEHRNAVTGEVALACAVEIIEGGGIVAIKALGGYQLACDAGNEAAVLLLRARKRRKGKPFALMVRDHTAALELCAISADERRLLLSTARPVVLLARRVRAPVATAVAPGQRTLGVMLPSTPLHHLLLARLDRPLVMTSGNRSDEPVAIDDATALENLASIADLFLMHDRTITARCDDSVVRHALSDTRMIRRARGYVPRIIPLAGSSASSVLGLGGQLKNTVCFTQGSSAMLSAHIGDLDHLASRQAFREAVAYLTGTAQTPPSALAHDLHPEYVSTHLADAIATELGVERRVPVQHHHAHVASCMAEHGLRGKAIGVVFDGAGLGTDGAIWGGEFLLVEGAHFTRSGHLSYVPLPGGDAAARRPWRSAAAHCAHAGCDSSVMLQPPGIDGAEWSLVLQLLARGGTSGMEPARPRTSSIGRLFDAVSSLLGLCHVAQFEGEAAMALEAAADLRAERRYSMELSDGPAWTADPAAMIRSIVNDRDSGVAVAAIAGAFHVALGELIVRGCERVREESGVSTVVLSGGVFMNALLLEGAAGALAAARFRVYAQRLVPCNDGGLSLGQAHVARCALEEDLCA